MQPGVDLHARGLRHVQVAQHQVEALSADRGQTRWRSPLPGRIVTVSWDNSWLLCSNEAGDLAATTHTYAEPGTYTVKATTNNQTVQATVTIAA